MPAVTAALALVWALHGLALRAECPARLWRRLGRLVPGSAAHNGDRLLRAAGQEGTWDGAAWCGLRLGLALLAAAAGCALGWWWPYVLPPVLCGAVAGCIGWLLPVRGLQVRVQRRRQRLAADLPQALDLLALAISGGLDLYAALAEVAAEAPPGPLAAELMRVSRLVALGVAPEAALQRLADQAAVPGLDALAAAVARARWLGAPLEQVLWGQAEALRLQLRQELMGRLGTLPLRLILVSLLCFLPPLLLVVVWPGLLALLGRW